MKKYIINHITSAALIIMLYGFYFNGYSQEKKQEFSISLGGPISYVTYPSTGELLSGTGFNAGLRYSYYLNEGLSAGIGVEYQSYSSDVKFQQLSSAYMTTDAEDENFQFRYSASNLREEQKLGYINIPIGIQFETSGTTKLYLAGGFKIGFAVSGNYETKIQSLTTSGYYPQYNVELFAPEFAGFGTYNDIKAPKQDLNTKVSYSITCETGVKQLIANNKSIYIGVYLDYGLNNIYDKNENKNVVQYNPELPVQFNYNSVLNSPFTYGDIQLLSYGIKLRFAIR